MQAEPFLGVIACDGSLLLSLRCCFFFFCRLWWMLFFFMVLRNLKWNRANNDDISAKYVQRLFDEWSMRSRSSDKKKNKKRTELINGFGLRFIFTFVPMHTSKFSVHSTLLANKTANFYSFQIFPIYICKVLRYR